MKNKWDKRLHTPLHTPSLYLTTVTGMRNAISGLLCISLYKDIIGMGYAMGYAASCSTC